MLLIKTRTVAQMLQVNQNKEIVLSYLSAMSGERKTRDLCEQYISDTSLIEHILFFDHAFPGYEMLMDEITAESNRVIVRARFKGKHQGVWSGIKATNKEVEFPFVIGYEIENKKIIHHWMIADQLILVEQLGVLN